MAASATYGSVTLISKHQTPVIGFAFSGDAFRQSNGWLFHTKLRWSQINQSCAFDQPLKQTLQTVLNRLQEPTTVFIPEPLRGVVLGKAYLCPTREKLWAERLLLLDNGQQEALANYLANNRKGSCFVQIVCDSSWDVPATGRVAPLWAEEDRLLSYLMLHTRAFAQMRERDYWSLRQFATSMLHKQVEWSLLASLLEAWTPFVEGWESGRVLPEDLERLPSLTEKALQAPPKTWCSFADKVKTTAVPCVEAFDF